MNTELKPYWTASGGRQIPYDELEDSHFRAIIKDGYRNPNLLAEAKRRKIRVPVRPVDKLTFPQIALWVESFASCAIEGNEWAAKMHGHWQTNPQKFILLLNAHLVEQVKRDKASQKSQ